MQKGADSSVQRPSLEFGSIVQHDIFDPKIHSCFAEWDHRMDTLLDNVESKIQAIAANICQRQKAREATIIPVPEDQADRPADQLKFAACMHEGPATEQHSCCGGLASAGDSSLVYVPQALRAPQETHTQQPEEGNLSVHDPSMLCAEPSSTICETIHQAVMNLGQELRQEAKLMLQTAVAELSKMLKPETSSIPAQINQDEAVAQAILELKRQVQELHYQLRAAVNAQGRALISRILSTEAMCQGVVNDMSELKLKMAGARQVEPPLEVADSAACRMTTSHSNPAFMAWNPQTHVADTCTSRSCTPRRTPMGATPRTGPGEVVSNLLDEDQGSLTKCVENINNLQKQIRAKAGEERTIYNSHCVYNPEDRRVSPSRSRDKCVALNRAESRSQKAQSGEKGAFLRTGSLSPSTSCKRLGSSLMLPVPASNMSTVGSCSRLNLRASPSGILMSPRTPVPGAACHRPLVSMSPAGNSRAAWKPQA